MPISSLCTTWTTFAAISTLATLATFALLATLTTFAKFDCYLLPALATLVTLSTLSSIATRILCQDVYLKVMSRTKSNLENLFSKKQRSTYSLICSDRAPNNYRVFKFPWSSFYFFIIFFSLYFLYVKSVDKTWW